MKIHRRRRNCTKAVLLQCVFIVGLSFQGFIHDATETRRRTARRDASPYHHAGNLYVSPYEGQNGANYTKFRHPLQAARQQKRNWRIGGLGDWKSGGVGEWRSGGVERHQLRIRYGRNLAPTLLFGNPIHALFENMVRTKSRGAILLGNFSAHHENTASMSFLTLRGNQY